jgi:hypothetical protein
MVYMSCFMPCWFQYYDSFYFICDSLYAWELNKRCWNVKYILNLFCCIVFPWLDASLYWFSFSFVRMHFLDFRWCHTYSVLDGHGCRCWSSVWFRLALALQYLLVGQRRRHMYVLSLPSNPNSLSLGEILDRFLYEWHMQCLGLYTFRPSTKLRRS